MEKKFDCVKMTREIRDKIYEEIKDMSDAEQVEYFNEKAKKAHEKMNIKLKLKV